MPVASLLSGITDLLTNVVGDYGLYAVFCLMLIDAVFPAASEPVMVYSGAVAAGAFAGQDVVALRRLVRARTPCVPGDGALRHARLHGRLAPRLGRRRLRRPPAARATRQALPSRRREARPRRALVRPLRRVGRLSRPGDPGRALVHLDPRRHLPLAVPALHAADAARLGYLVLRARGRRLGARLAVGGLPPRPSATWTTRSRRLLRQGSPCLRGSWPGAAAGWKTPRTGRLACRLT